MATPTTHTKIWLALRARVTSLVLSPVVPVLWPGEDQDLPTGSALEVIHMLNRPRRLFQGAGEPHQRLGILQLGLLTVSGPDHHEDAVREIAGDIADHFPDGLHMTAHGLTVKVTEAA